MKFVKIVMAASLLSFGASSFANNMNKTGDQGKMGDKDKTSMNTDLQFESVAITFAPGSSTLSSDDITRLNTAVADAKAKGDIKKAELAVWSDQEHPTNSDLPKAARKLADNRISAIKNVLRPALGRTEIITSYNMAEKSNWLARTFNTTEAELDSVYAKNNSQAMDREDLRMIKDEGAPSKGVVIFKIKEK